MKQQGQKHETEFEGYLSWREQSCSPTFDFFDTNIKAWAYNPTLVQSPIQLDHDFPSPVVIHILEFTNIPYRAQKHNKPLQHWHNLLLYSIRKKKRCWNIPCFCITMRNFMITFDEGRIITWRFPRFSALYMLFNASFNTLTLTIFTTTKKKKNDNRN